MRSLKFWIVVAIMLSSVPVWAVTVDGYAYLDDVPDHTGIMVMFSNQDRPADTDTAHTDATGYFTKDVATGRYNVVYTKTGYLFRQSLNHWLQSDQTLRPTALFELIPYPAISGDLSGVLGPGNFQVDGSIAVQSGQTLTIQPGTQLVFTRQGFFDVFGNLQAIGTAQDSIVFTRAYPDSQSAIRFDNASNDSRLEFCVIEYGSNRNDLGGGVYCANSSPTFSDCSIRNNVAGLGGGVYCYFSSPHFSNCIISNNLGESHGGGVCTTEESYPTFTRCMIINNSTKVVDCITCSGGGVRAFPPNSEPVLTNCTLYGNSSLAAGGTFYTVHLYKRVLTM
jgi:hypothetical protein